MPGLVTATSQSPAARYFMFVMHLEKFCESKTWPMSGGENYESSRGYGDRRGHQLCRERDDHVFPSDSIDTIELGQSHC